jgi:hypothetical protein
MPDTKITALAAITTVDPAADVLPIVDISDTSMAASGTTKKITSNQILGAGGTATLASATITGALTVNGGVSLANATAINFGGLLTIYSDTAAGLFIRGRTVTGTTFQTQDGTNPLLNISNSGIFTFSDGAGGTRMTLNATGLGVGVSPTRKLDVNNTGVVNNAAIRIVGNDQGNVRLRLENTGTSGRTWELVGGTPGVDNINFSIRDITGSTTPFTIDASGNVGIGVTPSGYRLHVRAAFASTVGGAFIESGEFNQKGLLVNCTSAALAANIVEFQREGIARLTLDSAGNLILQSSATPATLTTNGQLTVNATSNTNLRFSYRGSDGTTRVANITLA